MTIELQIQGAGKPVAFLHGTPTRPDVLGEFAQVIARTHTAIQVAFPGYGASDPLPDGWTYADLHDAIENALIARGFSDLSLIGFSGGGYHALALASRRRVSVRSVVAVGGFANLTDAERERYRATADAIESGADLLDAFHATLFGSAWRDRPGMREVTRACIAAASPKYLVSEVRQLATAEDLLPKLKTLDIPIIARHGTADQTISFSKSEEIAAAAPYTSLERVENAGHMLLLEDFEGTLTSMRRALQNA